MARSKQSRKGKKEWRRNISTAETDAFLDKHGKDERSGGPLHNVPSDSLFFVDKAKAPAKGLRKVDRARAKTLHADSILQRASLVPPVHWTAPRPKKVYAQSKAEGAGAGAGTGEGQGEGKGKAGPGATQLAVASPQKKRSNSSSTSMADLWPEEDLGGARKGSPAEGAPRHNPKRLRGPPQTTVVPAVEVDQPGCSFNPGFEDHQDALALAVAREVMKEARKDLEPKPPPLVVVQEGDLGALASEMEMYSGLEALLPASEAPGAPQGGLLEAAEEEAGSPRDGEGEGGGSDQEGPPVAPSRPVRVQKKTRADLNRRLRRREQEAQLAARQKRKRLLKDASRAGEIAAEIAEEEGEVQRRRERREVAREERRLEEPPRLSKHRFEPAPVSVLLSEEVTGSLRQIKGCSTLALDRFKSLQKRGLVETRVPVKRRAAKRRKIVEIGNKGHVERAMHAEILAMRAARKANSKGVLLTV